MGVRRRIVIVGSYMRDMVIGVDAFPAPGETRLGYGFFSTHGGKGSNQAVQAARCGGSVSMVAALGDDEAGAAARHLWAHEGVDASAAATRRGRSTGVAMIQVNDAGENQIVVDAGANLTLSEDDVDAAADLIAGAALVVAQLEVPPPAVRRAFEIARAAGVATLLNTAPAPRIDIADLVALSDILVANEVEAAALSRETGGVQGLSESRIAELARALGVRTLVATAGGDGAWLAARGRDPLHLRPPSVSAIVDTTAAGDAFIGAFAARLVATHDPEAAMAWGLAAGSLACTVRGALDSLPGRAAVADAAARVAARVVGNRTGEPAGART